MIYADGVLAWITETGDGVFNKRWILYPHVFKYIQEREKMSVYFINKKVSKLILHVDDF